MPTSSHRLPCAAMVPTVHQECVKTLPCDDLANLRRIQTTKTANRRGCCHVSQKAVAVSIEQRNIPVKLDSEAGCTLLLRSGLMTKEYLEIQLRMRRKCAKPRCLILNGVSGQNSQFHRRHNSCPICFISLLSTNERFHLRKLTTN